MMSLARKRGGRCLSAAYVNCSVPLLWECHIGHRWSTAPATIRKGSWCPDCAGVRRLTLEQMREIARSRGGDCLSPRYTNSATKLKWRCAAGHEWSAVPLHIKKGHWCPFCSRVARLTLYALQQIATAKGGRCLSLKYVNSAHPLRWRCSAGHEWMGRPASIRAGHWCPFCAQNKPLKLEAMRRIARERGGKCLSKTYKNGRTLLFWECRHGHQWKASPAKVKAGSRRKGTWCRECYNSRRRFHPKHSIEAMKDLARARGGNCLSPAYAGSKAKLDWVCSLGHRWQATPVSVIGGTWCPVCSHNQRLNLRLFQDIAACNGGECLSQSYVNEHTALWWRCALGHKWKAMPEKIKRGSWCARCARIRRRSPWPVRA